MEVLNLHGKSDFPRIDLFCHKKGVVIRLVSWLLRGTPFKEHTYFVPALKDKFCYFIL